MEQMRERVDLLPCPFCGSEAKIYTPPITIGNDEADVDWMRAQCTKCAVSKGFTRFRDHNRQSADFKRACAEAIAAWNNRPNLSLMQPEIDRRVADERAKLLERFDEDALEEIISDSLEMDWRPRDAARAIIAQFEKENSDG